MAGCRSGSGASAASSGTVVATSTPLVAAWLIAAASGGQSGPSASRGSIPPTRAAQRAVWLGAAVYTPAQASDRGSGSHLPMTLVRDLPEGACRT
jgi:hypothetical protein